MADYIKSASDADFLEKLQHILSIITPTPEDFGLTAAQVTAFDTVVSTFDRLLGEHVTAQADGLSKTQAKNGGRDDAEQLLRQLLRIIKANPDTTEAQIASFAIPSSSSNAAASSATIPIGAVDTSKRLQHTIHFADESTPDTKRKPKGTVGCEIYVKIGGEPPTDSKECQFLTLDTKTPHLVPHNGEDAGKMAHYLLRWQTKEGVTAWGETLSATITG